MNLLYISCALGNRPCYWQTNWIKYKTFKPVNGHKHFMTENILCRTSVCLNKLHNVIFQQILCIPPGVCLPSWFSYNRIRFITQKQTLHVSSLWKTKQLFKPIYIIKGLVMKNLPFFMESAGDRRNTLKKASNAKLYFVVVSLDKLLKQFSSHHLKHPGANVTSLQCGSLPCVSRFKATLWVVLAVWNNYDNQTSFCLIKIMYDQ